MYTICIILSLVQCQYLPGDANKDNIIDHIDAAIICQNWLKETKSPTWGRGDFNADCIVDDKDAALMAANWTQSTQQILVPEPFIIEHYWALAIIVIIFWYFNQSKNRE